MKNLFLLSMLVSSAMVCSCQKKDSAAEQQLAERTAELDAREEELAERLNSLNERMNSLDQKVKEVAEKQNAVANLRSNAADVEGQISEPAQVEAEKERIIQQLPTNPTPVLPKPSQLSAAEKQRQLEAAGAVSPMPQ